MNDAAQDHTPKKQALAPEAAEQEFERFALLWDIDDDTAAMSEDDADSFEKAKRPLVRGFTQGWLSMDDEGVLTFKLDFSPKMSDSTISLDPSKADVLTMDKYKERESMHKMKAYMATMAGKGVRALADLDARDEKRMRGAILLFLGS